MHLGREPRSGAESKRRCASFLSALWLCFIRAAEIYDLLLSRDCVNDRVYFFQRFLSAAFRFRVIVRPSFCPFRNRRSLSVGLLGGRKASAEFFGVIARPPHPGEAIIKHRRQGPG